MRASVNFLFYDYFIYIYIDVYSRVIKKKKMSNVREEVIKYAMPFWIF